MNRSHIGRTAAVAALALGIGAVAGPAAFAEPQPSSDQTSGQTQTTELSPQETAALLGVMEQLVPGSSLPDAEQLAEQQAEQPAEQQPADQQLPAQQS